MISPVSACEHGLRRGAGANIAYQLFHGVAGHACFGDRRQSPAPRLRAACPSTRARAVCPPSRNAMLVATTSP